MADRGRFNCSTCPDSQRVRRRCPYVENRELYREELAERPTNARHPRACDRLKVHPEMLRLVNDAIRFRNGSLWLAGGEADQENWWYEMVLLADRLIAEVEESQRKKKNEDWEKKMAARQ